ncbi:MAG: hypothetical protein K6E30_00290 [Lachnospiraceae bacterium]|nr:hypothetical protein [Lachnospiraceae bacterium]
MEDLHHEIFMAVLIKRYHAMQIPYILQPRRLLFSWQEDSEASNKAKILIIRGAGSGDFMVGGI